MGVNRVGFAATDDEAARAAARQEVIRRYVRYRSGYVTGLTDKKTVQRVERIFLFPD